MSLHLHFEPVMYVGRGYAHPDGFKHHHAYELVFSVFMLGDGRARVFATHGVEQEWRVRRGCEKSRKTGPLQ